MSICTSEICYPFRVVILLYIIAKSSKEISLLYEDTLFSDDNVTLTQHAIQIPLTKFFVVQTSIIDYQEQLPRL